MLEPLVSVVMSVYNTEEKLLRSAIESIISQSYKNYEFIIINDGSDGNIKEVLLSYEDNRIKIIENDINIGLTKSLNKGIKISKGKYIARMDADDVSLITRFEKQVNYLEKNKQVEIVGSVALKSDFTTPMGFNVSNNKILEARMFFFNAALAHSTAMIRKSFLEKFQLTYNNDIRKSQDYDLWVRALEYGKIKLIKSPLVIYRIHENQITNIDKGEQDYFSKQIRHNLLIKNNIKFSNNQLEEFLKFTEPTFVYGKDEFFQMHTLFLKQVKSNNLNKYLIKEANLWLIFKFINYNKKNEQFIFKYLSPSFLLLNAHYFIWRFFFPQLKLKITGLLFRNKIKKYVNGGKL